MGKIQIDALSDLSAKRHKIPRKRDAATVATEPAIPLLRITSAAPSADAQRSVCFSKEEFYSKVA